VNSHTSALGALDAFWATLRRQAERDPTFAAQLVKALSIPVEIKIETSADVSAAMPHLDPVVIAGQGLDGFRATFGRLKDADLRRVIKAYNLAPSESLAGKGAPKGEALVALLWEGASSQRRRLQERG
jgi:hypothetical protein